MTVSSQTAKVSYAGNGSTKTFAVPFYFLADGHLKVVLGKPDNTETVYALITNYTVADAGNPAGGSITLTSGTAAPASGETLVIVRNVPLTQETDYQANDDFPAESHERALDKLTMETQQLAEEVARSAKLPITSTEDADALVADLVRLSDSADNIDTVAGSIANVNTVATNIANVNTVAGISANVTTVAGISANVTTVAGNTTNINTVATNNANVTAVGGNIANVNAVAGNATNINAVAGVSTNVSTVAGIAPDVSAVAAVDGDVVQVAAIDGEVATVAGIASSVSTVAANQTLIAALGTDLTGGPITLDYGDLGENRNPATPIGVLGTIYAIISQIVTVANNNANVTTVGTNIAGVNTAATNIAAILDAPNQASIATTQAGIATTQAGIATGGANSAGAAQIAAEQARDQTLAAFDNFDDRYLGAKASNPTTDNDGNPLVPGALYYNTVAPEMRVWEGSMWVAAYASLSGALLKANNLSDLQSAATARTNLGLGSLAVKNSISATDLAANFDLGSIV